MEALAGSWGVANLLVCRWRLYIFYSFIELFYSFSIEVRRKKAKFAL